MKAEEIKRRFREIAEKPEHERTPEDRAFIEKIASLAMTTAGAKVRPYTRLGAMVRAGLGDPVALGQLSADLAEQAGAGRQGTRHRRTSNLN